MVVPDTRLKFYRWVRVLEPLIKKDQSPSRLIRVLIYLWQQNAYPRLLPSRAPWASSSLLSEPSVNNFVDWLGRQPFEEAAYWLATLYSRLVDTSIRSERAMFFTPPRLAGRVIDNLQKSGASLVDHKWHDPACGGSAFLVPLALRMMRVLDQTKLTAREQLKHIERNLSGNDLDEVLLELSGALLRMTVYPLIKECGYVPSFKLLNGDGLDQRSNVARKHDVVICNPPYRKLRKEEVERYRGEYSYVIEGQPNIYSLFVFQAVRLCREGGLVGLLTPTSFLSGRSFSKLRRTLTEKVDVIQLDILSNRTSTFFDVLQETAVSILNVRSKGKSSELKVSVSVLTESGEFKEVGECVLPSNNDPWPIPRSEGDAELLRSVAACKFGLSDYGYVAKVGHLVGYRDKRKRFAKFSAALGKGVVVPLIWATDIMPNGKFKHGRDHKIKRNAAFVRVLNLSDSGVVCNAAVLLQRLTSSDQRSRLVAAAVSQKWVKKYGGFVCENHVIVIEPKGDSILPVAKMAEVLSTKVVDRVFRTISSASNVGVSELKKLLLPDPRVLVQRLATEKSVEAAVLSSYGRTTK